MGDLLLMRGQKKQICNVKYMPNFRVCKITNDRVYDLQHATYHVRCAAVVDITRFERNWMGMYLYKGPHPYSGYKLVKLRWKTYRKIWLKLKHKNADI